VATAAPTEQPAHPKSAAAKGWIVQVGAFAKQDNADRLKEKLAHHGYATSVDKIASDKGPVLRVRVGPYASEAEARAAETRIQRELAVKGVVRTFP
jgi:cell division septation protein DedD